MTAPRSHHQSSARGRHHRRLRRVAVLPTLLTLANAACGFAALHFTARGMSEPNRLWLVTPPLTFFAAAAYMIFLGMIADAFDGRVARMSRSATSFGGQLDSLSDVITFGAAPAFLMLRVLENSFDVGPASPAFGSMVGRLLWLVAVAYLCCTALRLARFNVENRPEEAAHVGFSGLPSPAAAGVIASLVLLYGDLLPELQDSPVPVVAEVGSRVIVAALPFVTVAVALLMVSRIPYPHVLNEYLRGRRSFGHVVRVVLVALLLIWKPQLTCAVAFLSFAGSGAVRWFARWRHHHAAERPEPGRAKGDVAVAEAALPPPRDS